MPDLKDWRDDLYQPSNYAPNDMRPDRRLHNGVLYPSVVAMEDAKKREAEERTRRVTQAIAAKYASTD